MRRLLPMLAVFMLGQACARGPRQRPLCDAASRTLGCKEQHFTADEGPVPNPERGLFVVVELGNQGDVDWAVSLERRLVNVRVLLAEYQHRDLSPERLAVWDEGFEQLRRAGLKAVLRFQYNLGSGIDAPLPQVLAHIQQLGPLLRKNRDVIAVLQAGFVGAWGEWHSSANGLDAPEAKRQILDALLEALPTDRMVQVRTPFYKADYLPGEPLAAADAHSGTARARIGHHNDCLLATDDDNGTYEDDIEGWRSYVEQESPFVPVGGEACEISKRTGCASVLRELAELHWSYLNGGFPEQLVRRWKASGCYSTIDAKLGYRLVLHGVSWTAKKESLAVTLDLENQGYAAPFNPRPVFLVLEGQGRRYDLPITPLDPRRWAAGSRHHYRIDVPTTHVEPGSYRLSLWLPDSEPALRTNPAYSIRVASEGLWDPATGLNHIADEVLIRRRAEASSRVLGEPRAGD